MSETMWIFLKAYGVCVLIITAFCLSLRQMGIRAEKRIKAKEEVFEHKHRILAALEDVKAKQSGDKSNE